MSQYEFPSLPDHFAVTDNIEIAVSNGVRVLLTQPCESSNWISLLMKGNQEIARFAIAVKENSDDVTWIAENGESVTQQQISDLAMRAAVGGEAWEEYQRRDRRLEECE